MLPQAAESITERDALLTPDKQERIAVLIPCYNEELTIGEVVRQFRNQLPRAQIHVFDNNSTDRTVDEARAAGAIVSRERRQGKGYVVQSMFQQVDADVYVMVDGDGTYPPQDVHKIVSPVISGEADMVIGSRLHARSKSEFRPLNRLGNHLFLTVLSSSFKVRITDLLSGYRAFSRRFVKSVPLFGGGFETETELTIKALQRGYRIVEVPVDLGLRPEGSFSKLRIGHDGFRILNMLLALLRDYKPLTFFGSAGLFLLAVGILTVVLEFFQIGFLRPLASALLAAILVIAGMLAITIGLVLHTNVRRSQELDHQLRVLMDEMRYQIKQELEKPRSEI